MRDRSNWGSGEGGAFWGVIVKGTGVLSHALLDWSVSLTPVNIRAISAFNSVGLHHVGKVILLREMANSKKSVDSPDSGECVSGDERNR